MKLLNQSDSSFVPQPLTKQLSNASHWSWRHPPKLEVWVCGKYTQASTWLLEVACRKYVESIWIKYFEWSIWTNTSTDKKVFKIPNTQFAVFQIPNTKYKKYFKYVFEIQVFQILPTSDSMFQMIPRTQSETWKLWRNVETDYNSFLSGDLSAVASFRYRRTMRGA